MDLPGSPSPREFGEELRTARERAGVKLEFLVERTKIARRVLESLEAGEFEKLPNHVFMRLFLRQYLGLIHEDEGPWLAVFDAAWERFERASQPFPTIPPVPAKSRRVGPWLLGAALVALAIVVVVVMEKRNTARPTPVALPTPEIPAATAPPTQVPSPGPPELARAGDPNALIVRTVARNCWVEVTVASEAPVSRLMSPGTSWEISAEGREVSLLLGDAGAAEVEYLGEERSPAGADGEVVRLHLGPAATPQAPRP